MRPIDADALPRLTQIYEFNGKRMEKEIVDAKFIDKAPTIDAVPRWIPCGEKLPEPLQEVLVTGVNGCVYTSRIVHGEFEYGGNVIAWMPLPYPYKRGKEDEY